ncbi:hypothetical protein LINPERPRIM_LOCUS22234, partial [Linum perenne]
LHYSNPKSDYKGEIQNQSSFPNPSSKQTDTKYPNPKFVNKIKTWSTPGPSLQESPPHQQHTDTRHTRKLLNFNSLTLATRT